MIARRVGPGLVLAGVVTGIALGERAGPSPAPAGIALAGVGLLAALVGVATRRGLAGLLACCVAGVGAGTAVMSRALDGLVHSPIAEAADRRDGLTAWVVLAGDPVRTRFSARVLARVEHGRLESGARLPGGRLVFVDAVADAGSRLGVLEAGDRARLTGYLRPLRAHERHARWRHAVAAFSAVDLVDLRPARDPLLRVANALRARILAGHRAVPEPARALLAGFLLGDTADLAPDVVDDFRAAGLTHLLAVSGQNVAFVLALAGPLARRGPRFGRLVTTAAVLVVFAAMTRWEPSVLRASAMAACGSLSLAVGRPATGLRTLVLAVTGLLLVDPFLVHSVGFQLSCAASAGIAVLAPSITARVPGPRVFAEAVGVSVGAQVAVAPVLVAVFGGVPLIAIPANLVVAPVAGPLTVLGLLGGLAGGVTGATTVGAIASFPAYACAAVVLLVARWAAEVPMTVGPAGVMAAATVALLTFAAGRARRATWRRARASRPEPGLAAPPR